MIEELADVLRRPSASKRLAMIGKSAREVLADYVEAIDLVEPIEIPRVVPGDVDDDQVVAAAITARVDLIVSGDKHLLGPGSDYQGIRIDADRGHPVDRQLIQGPYRRPFPPRHLAANDG